LKKEKRKRKKETTAYQNTSTLNWAGPLQSTVQVARLSRAAEGGV
jgi:hypothetical protein